MSEEQPKKLREFLKEEGLELTEEVCYKVVKSMFVAARHAVKTGKSATAKMLVPPMLDMVEPFCLDLVDKIDGEDDR